MAKHLAEGPFKNGDKVEAIYHGSKYHGTVWNISRQWQDAKVTMAKGVDMILPLSAITKLEEGAGNGTYSI